MESIKNFLRDGLRAKRFFLSLLVAAAILAVPALALAAGEKLSFDPAAERELVRLLNEERSKEGLPRLELEERLVESARAHAMEMAQHDQIAHQLPGEPELEKRVARTNLRADFTGENVAVNSDAASAHHALMNSPGHRANMLHPKYNAVGMGVVRRGDTIYVAQNFAHRMAEISDEKAEEEILKAVNKARRKMPRVARYEDRHWHNVACDMAKRDKIELRSVPPQGGGGYMLAYTTGALDEVSSQAARLLGSDPAIRLVSLGACFARSESYPNGAYWIVMVLYH